MKKVITEGIHCIKTWPQYFTDVQDGLKTFETRRDDRNYQTGDIIILMEYDPDNQKYTGNKIARLVIYKLEGGQFGIEKEYCILGLAPMPSNWKLVIPLEYK